MPMQLMIIPDKNQIDNIRELKPGCVILCVIDKYKYYIPKTKDKIEIPSPKFINNLSGLSEKDTITLKANFNNRDML